MGLHEIASKFYKEGRRRSYQNLNELLLKTLRANAFFHAMRLHKTAAVLQKYDNVFQVFSRTPCTLLKLSEKDAKGQHISSTILGTPFVSAAQTIFSTSLFFCQFDLRRNREILHFTFS